VATPEVAILISTRNRYRELCRAVDSCLRQDSVELEIVICDDASSDETPRISKYDHRIRYYRSETVLGIGAQRAAGLVRCRAPFVLSLDDDAFLVSPYTLDKALTSIRLHSDSGALALPYMEIRGQNLSYHAGDQVCELRNFIGCAGLLNKPKVLESGSFPTWIGIWGGEDREVAFRLWERGWPILYDPSIPPLVHLPSTVRSRADMSFYGIRNQIISDWINVPTPYLIPTLVTHSLRLLLYKFTWRTVPRKIGALAAGYVSFLRIHRGPLPVRALL